MTEKCMIGLLNGTVEIKDNPHLIVDVNGVGYKVLVSNSILSKAGLGEKIKLFTYTHVREDQLELFGFLNQEELKLFEYLIGVSGVGPKTAIGIFSVGTKDTIINAIVNSDVSFFTSVPRLGRKNAQKIIIELKSKLGSIGDLDLTGDGKADNEVIAALKNFGFTSQEAREAIKNISGDLKTEEKIRMALKYLGK